MGITRYQVEAHGLPHGDKNHKVEAHGLRYGIDSNFFTHCLPVEQLIK
jgi:hypothetical protein